MIAVSGTTFMQFVRFPRKKPLHPPSHNKTLQTQKEEEEEREHEEERGLEERLDETARALQEEEEEEEEEKESFSWRQIVRMACLRVTDSPLCN